MDYDDGVSEYEVEFYSENTEFDYNIDAKTGRVVDYEADIDD